MRIRNTTTVLIAVALLCGCSEADTECFRSITFGYSLEDFSPSSRSTLASDGIEDRIESVSLFIYHNDRLIFSDYKTGDFNGMEAELENSWEYGFILRYAAEKAHITGIVHEPWHFRYVGTRVSMDMKDSGLCLEEYLGASAVENSTITEE